MDRGGPWTEGDRGSRNAECGMRNEGRPRIREGRGMGNADVEMSIKQGEK